MRLNYTVNFGSSISDLLFLNNWNMVERSSCSLVKGHHDLGLNRLRQVGFYLLLLLIDLRFDWLCTRGFASLYSIVLGICITTIFLMNCWIIFEAAYVPEFCQSFLIPILGNFCLLWFLIMVVFNLAAMIILGYVFDIFMLGWYRNTGLNIDAE